MLVNIRILLAGFFYLVLLGIFVYGCTFFTGKDGYDFVSPLVGFGIMGTAMFACFALTCGLLL